MVPLAYSILSVPLRFLELQVQMTSQLLEMQVYQLLRRVSEKSQLSILFLQMTHRLELLFASTIPLKRIICR